jgi:hypothetical protein
MKRQKIGSVHHVEKRDGCIESHQGTIEREMQLIGLIIKAPRIHFHES